MSGSKTNRFSMINCASFARSFWKSKNMKEALLTAFALAGYLVLSRPSKTDLKFVLVC